MKRGVFYVILASLVLSSLAFLRPIEAEEYTLTFLGRSWAHAINNLGQVVGMADTGGERAHAVLWENGEMIDLGTLGGWSSEANAISNLTQIVGASDYIPGDGRTHGFLWENGVMTDLGTLGGDRSWATDINDFSQAVGLAVNEGGEQHAVLWENGTIADLGTLLGGYQSVAHGINNLSQVVGRSWDTDKISHAFFWENGIMTDLGTLGGRSFPHAINDLSQVAGFSDTDIVNYERHAVLWENGMIIDLRLGDDSRALDINNLGQVVGYHEINGLVRRGFLWVNGRVIYLDELDPRWRIQEARGINDAGQIVGYGLFDFDSDGIFEEAGAFILTPTPPEIRVYIAPEGTRVPRGETLTFRATITNNTNEPQTLRFATNVTLPNGNIYPRSGYLFGPKKVTLNPYQAKTKYLFQHIPITAPLGTYTYHGYIGRKGVGVINEDEFDFEVVTHPTLARFEDWEVTVDQTFNE